MKLTASQRRILQAVGQGWTLKAHRDLEGGKAYRLHSLDPAGSAEEVAAADVQALVTGGWIDSNKKFPAATFWLTPAGKKEIAEA